MVNSVSIGAIDVDASLRTDFLSNLLAISLPTAIGSERDMKQKKDTIYENVGVCIARFLQVIL